MIGDLYNTHNVVVGQAACFVASAKGGVAVPAPNPNSVVMADAFALTPWTASVLSTNVQLTGGNFNLAYTYNGTQYITTTPILWSVTASTLANDIVALLAPIAPGLVAGVDVIVSGLGLNSSNTPRSFQITVPESVMPGTWAVITGSTTPLLPLAPASAVLSMSNAKWQPIGATDAGWSFVSNKTTTEINIEEQSTPVMTTITTQTLSIQGDMAEDVSNTLAIAYNMNTNPHAQINPSAGPTPPATPGSPGWTTLNPTDTVLLHSVALVMQNNFGYPRWLYIPVATCLANATAAFKRASAKRMYTVDFTSICPIGQIAMYNFTNKPTDPLTQKSGG